MRRVILCFFAVAMCAAPLGAASITNGGFEAVKIGAPFLSSNPADVPGWTHSGTVGDALLWAVGYVDGGGSVAIDAGDGTQFVTMGGGAGSVGTGSWSQTITGLTPGASYNVTFAISSEEELAQSVTATISSGGSATGTFGAPPSLTRYWRAWTPEKLGFTATSTTADLTFSATTIFDVGLDNVAVTSAAPEPASLILLGTGMVSLIGFARRRLG